MTGQVTALGIRDGDPAVLNALVDRRGAAVVAYCERACAPGLAAEAAADAFARFRATVIATTRPTDLDPEAALLAATRHAASDRGPRPSGATAGPIGRLLGGKAPEAIAEVPGLLVARAEGTLDPVSEDRLNRLLDASAAARAAEERFHAAEYAYRTAVARPLPRPVKQQVLVTMAAVAAPTNGAPAPAEAFVPVEPELAAPPAEVAPVLAAPAEEPPAAEIEEPPAEVAPAPVEAPAAEIEEPPAEEAPAPVEAPAAEIEEPPAEEAPAPGEPPAAAFEEPPAEEPTAPEAASAPPEGSLDDAVPAGAQGAVEEPPVEAVEEPPVAEQPEVEEPEGAEVAEVEEPVADSAEVEPAEEPPVQEPLAAEAEVAEEPAVAAGVPAGAEADADEEPVADEEESVDADPDATVEWSLPPEEIEADGLDVEIAAARLTPAEEPHVEERVAEAAAQLHSSPGQTRSVKPPIPRPAPSPAAAGIPPTVRNDPPTTALPRLPAERPHFPGRSAFAPAAAVVTVAAIGAMVASGVFGGNEETPQLDTGIVRPRAVNAIPEGEAATVVSDLRDAASQARRQRLADTRQTIAAGQASEAAVPDPEPEPATTDEQAAPRDEADEPANEPAEPEATPTTPAPESEQPSGQADGAEVGGAVPDETP